MSEIGLSDWIEARWFKGASRLFMIVGGCCMPVVGALIIAQLVRVDSLEKGLATVKTTQVERIGVGDGREKTDERFRDEVRAEIDDVKGGLRDVNGGIGLVREEIATIKGILQGMQRSRDVSVRQPLPF